MRETLDGPVVLLKGPEVAALYPEPTLRPFRDLDLLVPMPHEAWRSLVQAGFHPTGDPSLYVDIHHLRPLYLPGYPLVIELHSEPKWVPWTRAPRAAELFEAAVPSATGVDGVLARRRLTTRSPSQPTRGPTSPSGACTTCSTSCS